MIPAPAASASPTAMTPGPVSRESTAAGPARISTTFANISADAIRSTPDRARATSGGPSPIAKRTDAVAGVVGQRSPPPWSPINVPTARVQPRVVFSKASTAAALISLVS